MKVSCKHSSFFISEGNDTLMSRVTFETEVPTAVAVTQSPNTTKFQLQQRLKLTAYAPFCWNNADKKTEGAGGMKLIPGEMKFIPGRDETRSFSFRHPRMKLLMYIKTMFFRPGTTLIPGRNSSRLSCKQALRQLKTSLTATETAKNNSLNY